MSTLAPKISTEIAYERPVEQAPSALEAVLGTVTNLGAAYQNAQGRNKPSADQIKQQALSPFVEDLNEIAGSDMSQQEKNRAADRVKRSYLQQFPQYDSDIRAITGDDFGFESGQGDFERIYQDEVIEWMTNNPQGALAMAEVQGLSGQGGVSSEDAWHKINLKYREWATRQARIDSVDMDTKDDTGKWRQLAPEWTNQATSMAASLIDAATSNPEYVSDPKRALDEIDDRINMLSQQIISEGTRAKMDPAFINERLDSALKPLISLRDTWYSEMENPTRLLEATKAVHDLGLTELLVEAYGVIGADPKFREPLMTHIVNNKLSATSTEKLLNSLINGTTPAELDFDLGVDLPPNITTAATGQAPVTTPERVADFRRLAKEDPDFIRNRLGIASAALQSDDPAIVQSGLNTLVVAGEANEGPMGVATLRQFFTPENIKRIGKLTEADKAALASFAVQQVRQNRALLASAPLGREQRIIQRNGRFVLQRKFAAQSQWEDTKGTSQQHKSVEAVNFLLDTVGKFPEINNAVTNSVNWLYRGVEPDANQFDLSEDYDWDDLEEVQHVSYNQPNALVALVDETEAGGDYDALFGYSNRPGGQWSNVSVSRMTIGQVLEFQNPSGAYGNWVKDELGRIGQDPRIATPVGRYQYVGKTLAEVARKMELPLNTIFDQRTQDAIFNWHVRSLTEGKSDSAIPGILKNTWEGFKGKSDSQILSAYKQMMGLPMPDPGTLATGPGQPTGAQEATLAVLTGAEPKPNPFSSAGGSSSGSADIDGVDVEGVGRTETGRPLRDRDLEVDSTAVAAFVERQRQALIAKLSAADRRVLNANGINPAQLEFFQTTEEAELAMANGEVPAGTAYQLPDGSLHVLEGA